MHIACCSDLDLALFGSSLFQWANNITSIGQNPFILPQRVDPTATGFKARSLGTLPALPPEFCALSSSIISYMHHTIVLGHTPGLGSL